MADPESDPDFGGDLFALYGQPSRHWDDGGVTERILRELNPRDDLHRQMALLASVIVGLVGSAVALALVFAPMVNDLAQRLGAMPSLIWIAAAAVLLLLAAAATRLVLEE
jgi:uncharacterized membrane protein YeaQ/YmgE (transglycosylase-associated protein family)